VVRDGVSRASASASRCYCKVDKYKDIVLSAVREVSQLGWFTAWDVFAQIYGQTQQYYYWIGNERTPSPGIDRVSKILNSLRREGVLEYNPDSLGKPAESRIASC